MAQTLLSAGRQWTWMALWAVLLALGLGYAARAMRIDTDLRLFLPEANTTEERILLDELKEGPGTRGLLVALSGLPLARLAAASEQVASRLRSQQAFLRVENGTLQPEPALQELLLRYRYLLSPSPQGCACDSRGLQRGLEERLIELGSPAGAVAEELLLRDPSGELQLILDSWLPTAEPQLLDGVWFSNDDKQALLYLQTAAAGFDADQQRVALAALDEAVREVDPSGNLQHVVTGPGAFTVLLEQSIRSDVALLGSLAGAGSVLFLLFVLRSIRHTVLGLLCLATTTLAAIVAVSGFYPSVHGITLAFGFTLLGVAMDYPVHLMLHLDKKTEPQQTLAQVWPTVRLSIVTTCIAYLALVMTGFTGLTQLGTFTVCGLIATGVVIRWVLPRLVSNDQSRAPPTWLASIERLPRVPALSVILLFVSIAVLLASPRPLWSNELAGLTPVPQALQDVDTRLRRELGAPDLRFLVALRGATTEDVLVRDESLLAGLESLVSDHVIGGFESPSRLLPSTRRQVATQGELPEPGQLQMNLQTALKSVPFREDVFDAFLADVESSRALPPLTLAALAGSPLADRLDAMLLRSADETVALISLSEVKDLQKLGAWVQAEGSDVFLLDLTTLAENLIGRYRAFALIALGFALIAITGVMLMQLGSRATVAVVLPVLATLAGTVAVLNLAGVPLTLFHVVSLLLVGGLSFDYGLFFNRSEAASSSALRTRHSVMVCWVSTLGAFALLMLSTLPVLKAIGSTVSLGVTCGFFLALLTRRKEETNGAR